MERMEIERKRLKERNRGVKRERMREGRGRIERDRERYIDSD